MAWLRFWEVATSAARHLVSDWAPLKLGIAVAFPLLDWMFPQLGTKQLVAMSLVLPMVDSVCGLMVAVREGEAIQPAKFFRLGPKLVVYALTIGALGGFARVVDLMPGDLEVVSAAGVVAATEMLSITKHAAAVGMPIPKPLIKVLRGRLAALAEESAAEGQRQG